MKLKSILLLAGIAVIGMAFMGKETAEKLFLEQCNIQKAIDFEKDLSKKSEFLDINGSLSKSVFPPLDNYKIAKPIIVQRKQTGFLPVYAEYYFSTPDSIIRYISYDWEREKFSNFFKKQDMWKEESKKLKEYNAEYERIKANLVVQLGKPTTEDKELQTTKSTSGRGDYLSREANWETESYHAKVGMIFESMTYRIRMSYYWKK